MRVKTDKVSSMPRQFYFQNYIQCRCAKDVFQGVRCLKSVPATLFPIPLQRTVSTLSKKFQLPDGRASPYVKEGRPSRCHSYAGRPRCLFRLCLLGSRHRSPSRGPPRLPTSSHVSLVVGVRLGEGSKQGGREPLSLLSTPQREDQMERCASGKGVVVGGLVVGPAVIAHRLWSALLHVSLHCSILSSPPTGHRSAPYMRGRRASRAVASTALRVVRGSLEGMQAASRLLARLDSHLLSSKNQTLLDGWDALLLLDLLLDRRDLIKHVGIRACPREIPGRGFVARSMRTL